MQNFPVHRSKTTGNAGITEGKFVILFIPVLYILLPLETLVWTGWKGSETLCRIYSLYSLGHVKNCPRKNMVSWYFKSRQFGP